MHPKCHKTKTEWMRGSPNIKDLLTEVLKKSQHS